MSGESEAGQSEPALVVRRVSPDDWASYRLVRLAALADAPYAFSSTLEREQAFTEEQWRVRLGMAASFLAWQDGQPVGTATVLSHDQANEPDLPGASALVAMWVQPQARGFGAADRLVGAALDHARSAGAPSVVLWVFEANTRAHAFYRRMGFRDTETRDCPAHRPGEWERRMITDLA